MQASFTSTSIASPVVPTAMLQPMAIARSNGKNRQRNLLALAIIIVLILPVGMALRKAKAPAFINTLLLFFGVTGCGAALVKLRDPETARAEHVEDGLVYQQYKNVARQIEAHNGHGSIFHQTSELIQRLDAVAAAPAELQLPLLADNGLLPYAIALNPSIANQVNANAPVPVVATGNQLVEHPMATAEISTATRWNASEIADSYRDVLNASRTTGYAFVGAAGDAKTVATQTLIWINIQQHEAHPHGHVLVVNDRHQTSDDADFIPHWLGVPKQIEPPTTLKNGVWKNSFYDLVMLAEAELERRVEEELTTDKVPMVHLCLEELKSSYRKLSSPQVDDINNALEAITMEGRKYGMSLYVILHSPVENSGKKSGKGLSLEAFRSMTKLVGYGIANAPGMLQLCMGKKNLEAGMQRMERGKRDPRGWLVSIGGVVEDNFLPPLLIQSTRQLIINWEPCDGPGNSATGFIDLNDEYNDPTRTLAAVGICGRIQAIWQQWQDAEVKPSDEGLQVWWERMGDECELSGFMPSAAQLKAFCEMSESQLARTIEQYLSSENITL